MRKRTAAFAAIAIACAPRIARAEEPSLAIGARLGFSAPFGKLADAPGADLSSAFGSALPITIDFGVRLHPYVYAGVFAEYAYAFAASSACPGSCSAMRLRGGADVQVHVLPGARFDPWVGVGAGYEYARVGWSQLGVDSQDAYHGVELFELLGGLDWSAAPTIAIGPFTSLSFARYAYAIVDGDASALPSALHAWWTLGVRGHIQP